MPGNHLGDHGARVFAVSVRRRVQERATITCFVMRARRDDAFCRRRLERDESSSRQVAFALELDFGDFAGKHSLDDAALIAIDGACEGGAASKKPLGADDQSPAAIVIVSTAAASTAARSIAIE